MVGSLAMGARVALVACLLLTGCRTDRDALTLAIALLPGELPAYRAVLGEFERTSGHRTVLVPQQYADIRRALAAEAAARAHPGKIGFKGSLYEGLTCDVLPFVWAAGGRGDRLDDDGALAAFRLFAELAPYVHPQSETFKEPTIAEAMARGELVLHLNWPFAM